MRRNVTVWTNNTTSDLERKGFEIIFDQTKKEISKKLWFVYSLSLFVQVEEVCEDASRCVLASVPEDVRGQCSGHVCRCTGRPSVLSTWFGERVFSAPLFTFCNCYIDAANKHCWDALKLWNSHFLGSWSVWEILKAYTIYMLGFYKNKELFWILVCTCIFHNLRDISLTVEKSFVYTKLGLWVHCICNRYKPARFNQPAFFLLSSISESAP